MTAVPAGYIQRSKLKEDIGQVLKEAFARSVSEIVVGIPYAPDGGMGLQARKTLRFINALRRQISLPITQVGEEYSTAEATRQMGPVGRIRSKSKGDIDAASATVILQDYLDQKARNNPS